MNEFLYEIIENYKETCSTEEKGEIFKDFCSSLWNSKNKRRLYNKSIKFKVKEDLASSDIGEVFEKYSDIKYTSYRSMTKDRDWCSLIRQKINNLYTNYFDKEVILNKDYISALNKPKNMYYKWISGEIMNANDVNNEIEECIKQANEIRKCCQKQKMDLSWNDYKNVIEDLLLKAFNNCKLITDYETESEVININIYEFVEDNYYIKYICKYLENEMKQYQKKYYGVRNHKKYKRCKECGNMIESTNNRVLYCSDCAKKINREKTKNRMREMRKNKCLI